MSAEYKTIAKTLPGFPAELEWENLRAAGLEHLGKLAGKVWTDHNVHDPGITILEILCYALTDLAYRTNLPAADIFTRLPDDKSKDDNFFSPAEILTCNPVTILDFRKLLIDIDGVRNAWLEDSFGECNTQGVKPGETAETTCSSCWNGLYHVYVELENDYDLTNEAEKDAYEQVLGRIRETMMAHRNLCEDYMDIRILCHKEIGLCVDIELEADADAGQVYNAMIQRLSDHFSPSPTFYTLKYLLEEKKKSMEDVFAGRPYNIQESHGFVDTEEFEALPLRKELHLSDIYKLLFETPGIRSVRDLAWKKDCGQTPVVDRQWKWLIPENHIPAFSAGCSRFKFSRKGLPVAIDTTSFDELRRLSYAGNGKVHYRMPSPYLDAEMPKGVYRDDLGQYISVQNEFPRVYGIEEGGLPSDVSAGRKAQALQLKSYLLFYDQLLANYVGQLKNIRSLFAYTSPKPNEARQSYFLTQLSDVPEISALLRFPVAGQEGMAETLACPVAQKPLEDAIKDGSIKTEGLERFSNPVYYNSMHECDVAAGNVHQDISYACLPAEVNKSGEHCWFFYFPTTIANTVLLSGKMYPTEQAARQAADLIRYAATYHDNFRRYIHQNDRYSFNLEMKIQNYGAYLQRLVEEESGYPERRQGFLDHLLSRFAERFTDYALLSFKANMDAETLAKKEIEQKELFLTNIGDLSSNRGRAYDYALNGWNNENLSGFEKRTMALTGMGDLKKRSLCNFVIEQIEKYFRIRIIFEGREILSSSSRYYTREEAIQAIRDFFEAAKTWNNYQVSACASPPYSIKIFYGGGRYFLFNKCFEDQRQAYGAIEFIFSLFTDHPTPNSVYKSADAYRLLITNWDGIPVARSAHRLRISEARELIGRINEVCKDPLFWAGKPEGVLNEVSLLPGENAVIDKGAFTCRPREIENNKWVFHLSAEGNEEFRFDSMDTYEHEQAARESCDAALVQLVDEKNGKPRRHSETGQWHVIVFAGEEMIAVSGTAYETGDEAAEALRRMVQFARNHLYGLSIEPEDQKFRFYFFLGFSEDTGVYFNSVDEFDTREAAFETALRYYRNTNALQIVSHSGKLAIQQSDAAQPITCASLFDEDDPQHRRKCEELLAFKKRMMEFVNGTAGDHDQFIEESTTGNTGTIYRLADIDNPYAVYVKPYDNSSKEQAEKKKNSLFIPPLQYGYSKISLSEKVIIEYRDDNRKKWYHYQVICSNDTSGGNPDLVLFESVKGYLSKEAAYSAFAANLDTILNKALARTNYGPGQFISLTRIVDHSNEENAPSSAATVFIPDSTREHYSWYDHVAIDNMIRIARRYPVRYTSKEENEFYELFTCEKDQRDKDTLHSCKKKEGPRLYYFVLSDAGGEKEWQSTRFFASQVEARAAFHFFLQLLNYPGNYTVQRDCHCQWQIYSREVLLESKAQFRDAGEAWKAVERLVCASYEEKAFQAYYSGLKGGYSFDVSRHSRSLKHPYTYDTPGKRDQAIAKLFSYFKNKDREFPTVYQNEAGNFALRDEGGNDLAMVNYRDPLESPCHYLLFYLLDKIREGEFHEDEHGYFLSFKGERIAWTTEKIIPPDQWKARMKRIDLVYPIKKKETGKDSSGDPTYKYEIAINLPGFGRCIERGEEEPGIAWTSDCCFKRCEDAWRYLQAIKDCLSNRCNYRAVFDCECGPFGIQLLCQFDKQVLIPCASPDKSNDDQFLPESCSMEVLAFNPQVYADPRSDCEAIGKAKKLINTEGFHVVEHILLRPRCEEHCDSNSMRYPVANPCNTELDDCTEWKWKPSGEPDPCRDFNEKPVRFLPGDDPYSFIATAVLPIWPERFHQEENRLIVENILYRELPAHVLLRILWLKPGELCEFENHFRNWQRYMAGSHNDQCVMGNAVGDFTNYLFREIQGSREFKCIDCSSCPEENSVADPCAAPPAEAKCARTVQENINELFCWPPRSITAKEDEQQPDLTEATETEDRETREELQEDSERPVKKPERILDQERSHWMSKQQGKKRAELKKILGPKTKNKLIGEINAYIDKQVPVPERFKKLVDAVLAVKDPFMGGDKQKMIGILVSSLLDKLSFHKKNTRELKLLGSFIPGLKKKKIDVDRIFSEWLDAGREDLNPAVDLDTLQKMVTGKIK